MTRPCCWLLIAALGGMGACASDPFPTDLQDYATSDECVIMNLRAVPPDDDVPHPGHKTIYACHVTPDIFFSEGTWAGPPYPEGTLMLKESCMDGPCEPVGENSVGQDFVFLIATAEKIDGTWVWHEYTRNFADEELLEVPFPESACTGCHEDVKAADWMFTGYEAR